MSTATRPASEIALASLAILKVNWDTQQKDYIGNFVPFVAECLRKMPQEEVSLEQLRDLIFSEFGLAIPHGPFRTILGRAKKDGLVRVESGVLQRRPEALKESSIAADRDRALRQQAALIEKLRKFCAERHSVEWSDEEAEDALLTYVSDHAGPILALMVEGQELPAEGRSPGKASTAYLVNSFIIHVNDVDPEAFDQVETVVKGSMLANALYYPDISAISQKLSGLEVFFDTRIVLESLVGNEYQKRARSELFQLVYDLGGQPKIFDDTEREILAVLNYQAGNLRRGTIHERQFGLLTQQLIDSGFEASDLELIIARLPKALGSMKVTVAGRPKPSTALTVDEAKLEQTLKDCGGRYAREEPLHHDIDVITAIHRLRKGQRKNKLETSGAVFVTTNYPMIDASRVFFREEYDLGGVPRVYSDNRFETLIWLKKPLRAPDLPRRRILADSLAALRPGNELWIAYSQEIERLREDQSVSEEDFVLLKDSLEAKVGLMEVTLGEASAFSEGTVQEVLRRSRAAVQGEAFTEVQTLSKKLAEIDARAVARREMIAQRAENIARRTTKGILYASMTLLVLFIYLTLPSSFNGISSKFEQLIAPLVFVAVLALAVLTALNLGIGSSVQSLLRSFESSLRRRLETAQLRMAGLDAPED